MEGCEWIRLREKGQEFVFEGMNFEMPIKHLRIFVEWMFGVCVWGEVSNGHINSGVIGIYQ